MQYFPINPAKAEVGLAARKRYRNMTALKPLLLLCTLAGMVNAGTLENGLLTVDGKPFYVLSSWNDATTTIDDVARLGMNASYLYAPSTEETVKSFRTFMRRAARKDIQVIPYVPASIVPLPPKSVKLVSTLASEPNLLAWYVGDDVTPRFLKGIKQTVSILREESPHVAVVADYSHIMWEDSLTLATATGYSSMESPKARAVFKDYIDIRCQYTYPVTGNSLYSYAEFFDNQRKAVGDPLWTWIQCFMEGGKGRLFGLSVQDSYGPFPEPEQTRLMAFIAINRGVRGLLFFPHIMLSMQPELAAEVAYICQEVRLFNDQLAAGTPTFDLACSDTSVKATAHTYKNTVAVSMALMKDTYHRWIDDATVKNVTITVPWTGKKLPKAALLRLPDVINCLVAKGKRAGTVDITVPELEVAGLMLVSADENDFAKLRNGTTVAASKLSQLGVMGAVAQARKVGSTIWQIGLHPLYKGDMDHLPIMRANEAAAEAYGVGNHVEAVRAWRRSLRLCRGNLDGIMKLALARKPVLSSRERLYLHTPYALFNIPELLSAVDPDEKWHYVRNFLVVGSFPLGSHNDPYKKPDKFDFPYGPEKTDDLSARFESADGETMWKSAGTTLTGRLDLLQSFGPAPDVLCYVKCTVISPVDSSFALGLGSNDGVILWVNGEKVFSYHKGRTATPHENVMKVRLREGKNRILVKVVNFGENWGLFLSFVDPKRVLEYSAF
jgi:hypothetical protein